MTLDVYLGSDIVGKLADMGGLTFQYMAESQPVSLSMPVREAPYGDAASRNFFTNLFFENTQLDDVVAKHGLDRNDVVGILTYLGKDCPGAISAVPEGEAPGKRPGLLASDYVPVEDEEALMRRLQMRRLGEEGGDPSPLPGVQGKIAVTLIEGRLHLPLHGAPTTHILKVPRAEETTLVADEYHLLRIAKAVQDHPVTEAQPFVAGSMEGLLITRYDRTVENGRVDRIHQEDFCQALGLHPQLKYERNAARPELRFSAKKVGELLSQTKIPARARSNFLTATLLNLALGNTDNHAKNHSLIYHGPKPELAPLYDIVPILLDPSVTHDFAFKIGASERVQTLSKTDIEQLSIDLGFGRHGRLASVFDKLLQGIASHIPDLPRPKLKGLAVMLEDQLSILHEKTGLGPNFPNRDFFPRTE